MHKFKYFNFVAYMYIDTILYTKCLQMNKDESNSNVKTQN